MDMEKQQREVAALLAPYADPCGAVVWPRYSVVGLPPSGPVRFGGTENLSEAREMARHRQALHGWPVAVCRTSDTKNPIMTTYPKE